MGMCDEVGGSERSAEDQRAERAVEGRRAVEDQERAHEQCACVSCHLLGH